MFWNATKNVEKQTCIVRLLKNVLLKITHYFYYCIFDKNISKFNPYLDYFWKKSFPNGEISPNLVTPAWTKSSTCAWVLPLIGMQAKIEHFTDAGQIRWKKCSKATFLHSLSLFVTFNFLCFMVVCLFLERPLKPFFYVFDKLSCHWTLMEFSCCSLLWLKSWAPCYKTMLSPHLEKS
jgi:hypothetical protein